LNSINFIRPSDKSLTQATVARR